MRVLLAAVAATVAAAPGSIQQLPGAAGCVNSGRTSGCAKARAVSNPLAVAVSPDGRNVYAAGGVGSLGTVAVFARARDGRLVQLPGRAGCVSRAAARACVPGRGLETAAAVAVSPDGRLVVTAARNGRAIGVYRRGANGALVSTACFQTGAGGGCRKAPALHGASGIAFSPSGRLLVVASADTTRGGLSLFRSDAGRITPVGCVNAAGSRGCVRANGLFSPVAVAFTPDGQFAYVVSGGGARGSLSTFSLGANGEVEQLQCIEQPVTTPRCQAQREGLAQPAAVAVAAGGSEVYVASTVSGALVVFPRTRNGALLPGAVHRRAALRGATGVAATRDGGHVVVSSSRYVIDFARGAEGLVVRRAFRPRGVSSLRAVVVSRDGRNAYVAGRGLAALRLS